MRNAAMAERRANAAELARPPLLRAASRQKVFSPVWLLNAGERHRAHVLNLSPIGAGIQAKCVHRVWSGITLQVGELAIEGRITWVAGERCGIKFAEPLSADAMELITG